MKGKMIKLGGQKFVEYKRSDLPGFDDADSDGNERVLMPYHPPDDYLEFPANAKLENSYFLIGSGLATHSVMRKESKIVEGQYDKDAGFPATDLDLFSELDWHGECFGVLHAHGWLGRDGDLSDEMVSKVSKICGDEEIQLAKDQWGENWKAYIGELAAVHFAKPLSRLWYAANMMSLYYIHYDDMRLGFLWAEYQIRMRHEADSLRGKKSVTSAQSGGENRARMFSTFRREIMQCMRTHVSKGKPVSSAALLTFKSGLGSSAEANRKLWMRHSKK